MLTHGIPLYDGRLNALANERHRVTGAGDIGDYSVTERRLLFGSCALSMER